MGPEDLVMQLSLKAEVERKDAGIWRVGPEILPAEIKQKHGHKKHKKTHKKRIERLLSRGLFFLWILGLFVASLSFVFPGSYFRLRTLNSVGLGVPFGPDAYPIHEHRVDLLRPSRAAQEFLNKLLIRC